MKRQKAKEPEKAFGMSPPMAIAWMVALGLVLFLGVFAMRTIHATMPSHDASGGLAETILPERYLDPANMSVPRDPAQGPSAQMESEVMMRSQGWIRPPAIETLDTGAPKTELATWDYKDGVPPEIARIPEQVMDLPGMPGGQALTRSGLPAPPTQMLASPPPLMDTTLPPPMFGRSLTLDGQSGELAGGTLPAAPIESARVTHNPDDGRIVIDRPDVASITAGNPNDPLGALISGRAVPAQGVEPQASAAQAGTGNNRPAQTLSQAMDAACANAGFFGRFSCEQQTREKWCAGRWNQVRGCERNQNVNNF
ncbi:MAG: hypothetical protein R3E68_06330 [Burkholderiaceae bacterium]